MIKSTCPGSPELIALGAEAVLVKACYEGMPSMYKVRVRSPTGPRPDTMLIRSRRRQKRRYWQN